MGRAMTQLLNMKYADKYREANNKVYLVTLEFSSHTRNIMGFGPREV